MLGKSIFNKKFWKKHGYPNIHRRFAEQARTKNGSPRATIETNEERSFINIFIPIHEGCGDTVILNVPHDVPQGVPHDIPLDEDLDLWIEEQITKNPNITTQELADLSQRSSKIIKRHILKPPHIQHKGSEIQRHPSKHI